MTDTTWQASNETKDVPRDQQARVVVLAIDEDELSMLVRAIPNDRYQVLATANVPQALELLAQPVDVVVADLHLGNTTGTELMEFWRRRNPLTRFLMISSNSSDHECVEAIKGGADGYLRMPLNQDELLVQIERCVEGGRKDALIEQLSHRLDGSLAIPRIVGQSKPMLELLDQATRAARSSSPILIQGEPGTGKQLLAAAIHQHGSQRNGPFVTVNTGAFAPERLDVELFGSDSTAGGSAGGQISVASGGTLFIDEISALSAESQAKLLQFLERSEAGATEDQRGQRLPVRLISATTRNLERLVKEGGFREDLYYRLSVVSLRTAPLRQRSEDVPLLIAYFLSQACTANQRPPLKIDPSLRDHLETFDWPGNVRQLRNCLESMTVLARGDTLTLEDLPASLASDPSPRNYVTLPPGTKLEDLEREAIERALEAHHGNRTHAAESLGISVRTLQRKIKAWGLAPVRDGRNG